MAQHGAHYEIVVRGRLGPAIIRSLGDVDVVPSAPDVTCLRVEVRDQAALQGLLAHLADLAVELRSLRRLPDGDDPDVIILNG